MITKCHLKNEIFMVLENLKNLISVNSNKYPKDVSKNLKPLMINIQ